jgi:uncharacterized spore protein YtfJ
MTEENGENGEKNELETGWEDEGMRAIEQVMSRLLDRVRAETVFDSFVERDNTIIIPCAEVVFGMGMGVGSGESDEQDDESSGGGGGGGGGGRGRPVAAIVVTPDQVRVEPIVDVTKIALAALTTFGFVAYWLARLSRTAKDTPRHEPSLKDVQRATR